jgi:4-amino-4-deoxy-L-arabinose transferase-like glycosyltransferase
VVFLRPAGNELVAPTDGCRSGLSARSLLAVALGVALVLRVGALSLAGDISAGANIWEYGEQGLCAWRTGGDLCFYYSPGGESYPSAYMPPLLSYTWLGLFDLFGDGPTARAVWLAGNLAAALGCVALIFYLSLKLWPSRWAAFASATLFAAYPTFVFVTATYHQTNWAVLFLLAISAVAVKLAEGTRPLLYGALGGVLCGLAALNRSEMLIIGPVLIALGAAWRRSLPALVKAGLAGALVMVLTLAPWTARNYEHFGQVIPAAHSTGYNLWKGFNPYTNGSGNLSEDPSGPGFRARESIRASVTPGPRYETRVQDAFMEVFKDDVRAASPGRLVRLTANKALLLWGFDWTDRETTGRLTYQLPWLGANLLAVIGLVAAWRWRRQVRIAPAAVYAAALCLLTAAYVATAVHARYRMHIEPYLFILAGIGAEALWARLRRGRGRNDVGLHHDGEPVGEQGGV